MGFFTGTLTSPTVKTPNTGFYSQPQSYQSLYNNNGASANSILYPNGQLNTGMFNAPTTNQFEQNAQGMINQGVTPTATSLASDVSMLTNPFDSSVINSINHQAQGQNSLVNQAATQAGQQGSNRSFLGTSDVEQNRLNSIGQFQQGQYNTAVNQSLGALSGLRQQDINNNLTEGAQQRGIAEQNQMAPLSALQAAQGVLNQTPTGFNNFGYKASSQGGGLNLGDALKTAKSVASFF